MKKSLLFILLICSTCWVQAQDTNYVDPNYEGEKAKRAKKNRNMADRIYVGGTFGLQFGGSYTSILVEPLIGFKMTEKLSTGVGIGVRYGQDNLSDFSYTNYLGRFFARYIVLPSVYAHIEYMAESYDSSFGDYYRDFNVGRRTTVPFLFVGGGLRRPAGNGSFIVQVLFNVLQTNSLSNQIYPGNIPYISVGYIGGF